MAIPLLLLIEMCWHQVNDPNISVMPHSHIMEQPTKCILHLKESRGTVWFNQSLLIFANQTKGSCMDGYTSDTPCCCSYSSLYSASSSTILRYGSFSPWKVSCIKKCDFYFNPITYPSTKRAGMPDFCRVKHWT